MSNIRTRYWLTILLLCLSSPIHVHLRIYQRCDLAYELLDLELVSADWETYIPYMLCNANYTGYNTLYMEYMDGIADPGHYGILMIPLCSSLSLNCSGIPTESLFPSAVVLYRWPEEGISPIDVESWYSRTPFCRDGTVNRTVFTEGCTREIKMDPPADTIVLTEGDENVRINCSARGYPSPSIVFVGHSIDRLRVDTSFDPNPVDINYFGYLNFEYVLASDAGRYHCVASNSMETVWKEFNIHVNVLEVSTSDETSPASTPSLTENTESTTHFSSSETSPISLSTPTDQTETPNPTQRTSFFPTFLTTTTVPSTASTTPIPHTIYTPCGLAREMTYLLEDADMWDENIETWVCLAGRMTSFYNTSYFSGHDEDGYATYGLFKISNRWCSDDQNLDSPCNSTCVDLLNRNLQESVRCAEKIRVEKGFTEWLEYKQYCLPPPDNLLEDCMRPPTFVIQNGTTNSHIFREGEKNASLTCTVMGYPPPIVKWDERTMLHIEAFPERINISESRKRGDDGTWTVESNILFLKAQVDDERIYHCSAKNYVDTANKTDRILVLSEGGEDVAKLSWSLIGALLGILSLFGVPIIGLMFYARRKKNHELSDIYVSFKYGSKDESSVFYERKYMHVFGIPFPRLSICTPEQLSVYSNVVLGRGAFGTVLQGRFNRSLPAAVKTTSRKGQIDELKNLLMEAKILGSLRPHPNIVKLFGVDISRLKEGYAFVALEFCDMGSLKGLLDKQRRSVMSHGSLSLDNMPGYLGSSPNFYQISQLPLKAFVLDVCSGMAHLAASKIVHGDLAARNVLIDLNMTAKITDFGLSHQLSSLYKNYVTADKDTCLPWRWLPVESLKFLKFSEASDVWSFGVLMWEVFSYGELPYGAAISWNPIFTTYLEQGFRLQKPHYCEEDIYTVMQSCWEQDASDRPTFSELLQRLQFVQRTRPPSPFPDYDKEAFKF